MGTGAATQVARAGGSKEPSKLIGSQSAEHSWAELWTAYTSPYTSPVGGGAPRGAPRRMVYRIDRTGHSNRTCLWKRLKMPAVF